MNFAILRNWLLNRIEVNNRLKNVCVWLSPIPYGINPKTQPGASSKVFGDQ